MKEISFDVKYKAGHSYKETWSTTEYCCPNCGAKEVWVETSGGDFYVGDSYRCDNCQCYFYLPNGININKDMQAKQRTDAFVKAKD